MTLRREIVLRGRPDWAEVVATVREAAPSMARAGRPLRVILADDGGDRLDEQVKFYWKAVVEPIAAQAVIDGQRFTPRAWHKHLKGQFLPPKEMRLPDGSVTFAEPSIARGEITVGAMAHYINEVKAHAATAYGVIFE